MAATREDVRAWVETGYRSGASHVIVVCDTFDHEDYPVYVGGSEDYTLKGRAPKPKPEECTVQFRVASYSNPNNMQKVMEVYSMAHDLESQLAEFRSWNLD